MILKLPLLGQDNSPLDESSGIPLQQFFRTINSVTVKVTSGCNLKCHYCNVDTRAASAPQMPLTLWRRISDLVLRNTQSKFVSIEFHGGEPLLLGIDFLCEAATYTRRLAREVDRVVEVPLVTNGLLITREVVHRLREVGVGITLSCDGPPSLNDQIRGGGIKVEQAVKLLVEEDYCEGVMIVMSRVNYAHMSEVMQWFESLGVRDLAINCIQPQGRGQTQQILTGEQMHQGFVAVFQHMAKTHCSIVEHRVAQYIRRFIEGRKPSVSCWDFECQAGKSYVSIDLEGSIFACGSDVANHKLGNIHDAFIGKAHCRSQLVSLHSKASETLNCFECPAKRICDHSCPTADFNSREYARAECLATRLNWEYFCKNSDLVRTVYACLEN